MITQPSGFTGLGYASVDLVGAVLAGSGLVLALSSGLLERRAHVRESLAAESVAVCPNALEAPADPVPEPALAAA